MRPDVADMTVADWMEAKTAMNRNAFKQLIQVAKLGRIQIPSVVMPHFTPRVEFMSESETAMLQRVRDTEALNKFNQGVKAWAKKVERQLKASAQSGFSHRQEDSEKFPHLAKSIKAKVQMDKQYKIEARSIGFTIARHGVYLHRGAGRGYGGVVGSKWTDKYSRLKTTAETSLNKMNTGNRQAVHWFNSILEQNQEELAAILADYSLDMVLNISNIFITD